MTSELTGDGSNVSSFLGGGVGVSSPGNEDDGSPPETSPGNVALLLFSESGEKTLNSSLLPALLGAVGSRPSSTLTL